MIRHRPLYFITPSVGAALAPTQLPTLVERAIRGGVGLVQWRQKPSAADLRADLHLRREWERAASVGEPFLLNVARDVRRVAAQFNVPFIVNDSLELALQLEADGVHVGQTDAPLAQLQGLNLIVGVTVRDGAQARAACEGGATYLGAGPVFSSSTKPHANDGHLIGIDGLRACTEVAREFGVPVYAIGGLSLDERRIQRCITEGGTSGVAVVAAIGGAHDVEGSAAAISAELESVLAGSDST
ncbi:hypothetical protein PybrP1_001212 [[Pythium] brassicae (nom. inval.)]|nr:hypothetical protein PybrP1_001212 [[Pythium] brassicae (nom. inval.)]